MKKIIPFRKDIEFKTNLSEITSISLENTLNMHGNTITGDFIVSGDYKITNKSTSVDPFEYKLPFEIVIDDRYDTERSLVDIDNFYYEILNDNTLSIAIDVLVDGLEEKDIVVEEENYVNLESEDKEMEEERCIEEEDKNLDEEEVEEKINSVFSNTINGDDNYVTYNVYIVRDGDTLDSIMEKYSIKEDELKKYNDLSNLKLGDKLIIPNNYERN